MRVLVIDDDVVSRMVLMHLVDSCGSFEVAEAEDGSDAWDQLTNALRTNTLPAICFCDLRMPRLSGMELLERVKAVPALAGIAFVMVSSATEGVIIDQTNALGAAGYIAKPFQADQVRAHLDQLMHPESGANAQSETPRATMQRLGINSERLLAYLGGFLKQVHSAAAELPALLAQTSEPEQDPQDAARVRLERLHTGCTTLGLQACACALSALANAPLQAGQIDAVLHATAQAVRDQQALVQRESAPA